MHDRHGNEVTTEQIRAAFEAGKVRLVHGYKIEGGCTTAIDLSGEDWDTRGKTTMMAAESWTRVPATLQECLDAAR